MSPSIIYLLLAALGLSFLVFIHELGHYIVARRMGMKVEVFSIGFGRPLYVWYRKGVKWQICYLPFGGYVKIAGMEAEKGKDPHEIKDGFYSKAPWKRILVALMGPIVNIVFALAIFTLIFLLGGRMKPFEEFTNIIGWVDPKSELAANGVRPGDTIGTYNNHPFTGFRDLMYNGVLKGDRIEISGNKVDYYNQKTTSYSYDLVPYHLPHLHKDIKTIGILSPASILNFNGLNQKDGEHSPMAGSGIREGDRVVWANGELVFSSSQLSQIVNQSSAYLTIERNGKVRHLRVPKVMIGDLQMDENLRDEFGDWRRHLQLSKAIETMYFIPYEVDLQGRVTNRLTFIDSDLFEENAINQYQVENLDQELHRGDTILAVNGRPVEDGLQIFESLLSNEVLLMVQSPSKQETAMTWQNLNTQFKETVNWKQIQETQERIGTTALSQIQADQDKSSIRLLNPITPISYKDFLEKNLALPKTTKDRLLQANSTLQDKEFLFLGSTLSDQLVHYNPPPLTVFKDVVKETWRTLSSLLTGTLSPKWLSGPVGIVKLMHDGFSLGIKEALYWIAMISLNLGLINLLPIPVLDGGHICFAIWEAITKKRISSKAMEKMILPFFVLLIMLFIYITYQDITRLLT